MAANEKLLKIDRLERLRIIRGVCLTLGFLAIISAIACVGGVGVGNPENWSSAFVALRASGYMRWLIVPLGALGVALLVVGIGLTAYLSREIRIMTNGKVGEL
jgi:hypothetical protein